MKRIRNLRVSRRSAWLLLAVGPLLLGGCPDLRDGVVDAFESATISAIGDASSPGTPGVLERGLAGTLARVFFDRLRDPATP
jgi:hypothetical protein